MAVNVTTLTIEDIKRRRAEIQRIIDTPEFKERRIEGVLLRREELLLEELEDLDYLQYGRVETH